MQAEQKLRRPGKRLTYTQQMARRAAKPSGGESRRQVDPTDDSTTFRPLYIPMPCTAVYSSPAWRGMTPAAKAVLECILAEYGRPSPSRRCNGAIVVTYDQFESHGIRRKSIPSAIKRGVELGFITFKRGKGGKVGDDRRPSRFGVTFLDGDDGAPATHDWARPECAERGYQLASIDRAKRTKTKRRGPNVVELNRSRAFG